MQTITQRLQLTSGPGTVTPFAQLPLRPWRLSLSAAPELTLRRLDESSVPRVLRFLDSDPLVAAGLALSADRQIWVGQTRTARRITLLASSGKQIIGVVSVVRRYLDWMRHLAEVDLLLSGSSQSLGPMRRLGASGTWDSQDVAAALLREILRFAPAMGMRKILAAVPRSIAFEPSWLLDSGFQLEATLADWIEIEPKRTSDLEIFTLDTDLLAQTGAATPAD